MPSETIFEIGAVDALWRYPVKSMGGESLDEAFVLDGGIIGDRAYAIIDPANGKVASAKHPRKWARLMELSASYIEPPDSTSPTPPVRIRLPNGTEIFSDQDDPNASLSKELGRPAVLTTTRPESISLERVDPLLDEESILDIGGLMMEGRFSDYAAIHLLTTATLSRLSELGPESLFDVKRFRPNVLIETAEDQAGFMENTWVGRTVAIGDEVRLRVTDPTPRCSIPTLAQNDLDKDPKVLRTIAAHNQVAVPLLDGSLLPCAGVYAFVIQGGTMRTTDTVRIEGVG